MVPIKVNSMNMDHWNEFRNQVKKLMQSFEEDGNTVRAEYSGLTADIYVTSVKDVEFDNSRVDYPNLFINSENILTTVKYKVIFRGN